MSPDREFIFRPEHFHAVRDLLYRHTGINLSEAKSNLVYSRLSRRLRLLGLADFRDYLQFLSAHSEELEHFINALTTNHTAFFREPHHFDTLADFAQGYRERGQPLRIWCAAASTGEEPWSIAMVLAEVFDSWSPPAQIIATDIDSQVLRHAQAGVYEIPRLAGVSAERRQRFFNKGKGGNLGKARIAPQLRAMVSFAQLNLLDPNWAVKGPFDVIFCRNVMIYFDKPTQLQLLSRMVVLLKPNGLYIAGHSESFVQAGHLLRLVAKSTYQPLPLADGAHGF